MVTSLPDDLPFWSRGSLPEIVQALRTSSQNIFLLLAWMLMRKFALQRYRIRALG